MKHCAGNETGSRRRESAEQRVLNHQLAIGLDVTPRLPKELRTVSEEAQNGLGFPDGCVSLEVMAEIVSASQVRTGAPTGILVILTRQLTPQPRHSEHAAPRPSRKRGRI